MLAVTASLVTATTAGAWPAPPATRRACADRPVPALCKLHWWIRATHRAERARGLHRTRYWYSAERNPQEAPWLAQREAWRFHDQRITAIPLRPWTAGWYADARCVHHYEGAWNAIDPTGTYYGGMQMDASFQATYGAAFLRRYGTADHWPPVDQLLAAYRAWQRRGWTPWPQTSLMCGL